MITVNELYEYFEMAIPSDLSCEWDNDGRMCVPSPYKKIEKILITLDVSEGAVDYAAENGFDCIISHHPMIFDPMKNVDSENGLGRKLCKLIKNDIAVFSFHTRLDAVSGGVNDALADILGLKNIYELSELGCVGEVEITDLTTFAERAKKALGADRAVCTDSGRPVRKVAVVGGSGKGFFDEVIAEGCDTFLTGEVAYNYEHEAKEAGLNLVCCGHYFTENIVLSRLEMLVNSLDCGLYAEKYASNPSFVL